MLCKGLKAIPFILNVTADFPELPCSHERAVFVYNEALASSCTLWGVQADESDLYIRYDK